MIYGGTGGTIYPGLMVTAAVIHHILNFFHFAVDVRNVCVFLAPLFSSFTTIVTYLLTKELKVSWRKVSTNFRSLSLFADMFDVLYLE